MKRLVLLACFALTVLPVAAQAASATPISQGHNTLAIGMFLAFVASTLSITRWAARRNNSVSDHYAAGGKITREPGPMKHGTTVIAFVVDPDGYKIELIEEASRGAR